MGISIRKVDLERLGLFRATTISALVHGVIVALLLWGGIHVSQRLKEEQLRVVRIGMLSNRQMVKMTKGSTSSSQARQESARKQQKQPKSTPEKPKLDTPKLPEEKPVANNSPMEAPVTPKSENSASTQSAARSVRTGGEIEQAARTTSLGGSQSEDPIHEYIAWVAQMVNSRLMYPKEMRKHGVEGMCWVAFTVTPSGEIESNSLRIVKSSGQNSFDTSALKTVASCAPFKKPPRRLAISLNVTFTTDRL